MCGGDSCWYKGRTLKATNWNTSPVSQVSSGADFFVVLAIRCGHLFEVTIRYTFMSRKYVNCIKMLNLHLRRDPKVGHMKWTAAPLVVGRSQVKAILLLAEGLKLFNKFWRHCKMHPYLLLWPSISSVNGIVKFYCFLLHSAVFLCKLMECRRQWTSITSTAWGVVTSAWLICRQEWHPDVRQRVSAETGRGCSVSSHLPRHSWMSRWHARAFSKTVLHSRIKKTKRRKRKRTLGWFLKLAISVL